MQEEKMISIAVARFSEHHSYEHEDSPSRVLRMVAFAPCADRERLKYSILEAMTSGQFSGHIQSDFLVFDVPKNELEALDKYDPHSDSKERDISSLMDKYVPNDRISSVNFKADAWKNTDPQRWSFVQRQQAIHAYQDLMKISKMSMSFPDFVEHKQRCFDIAMARDSVSVNVGRSMRNG